jgi:hypothetical protein
MADDMIIVATHESTWDMIAVQAGLDEFAMTDIMADNSYAYSDVITFDGGEQIQITTNPVVQNQIIAAPWDE